MHLKMCLLVPFFTRVIFVRLFIVFLLVVSVAWVPVIESTQGGEMYSYIQSVAAYLSPPIAAVYCTALFNPQINEPVSPS
jgi:uncharacterized sodium:solute symporter family permease YidK